MIGVLVLTLAAMPITLDQARSLSREQNSAAVLADLTRANSVEGLRLARSAIYPQAWLGGNGNAQLNGPSIVYTFDPTINVGYGPGNVPAPSYAFSQYGLSLNVQQLIFDGGKWWSAISQAGAQEVASERQLDEQRNVSEFEGVRRFYELYRGQRSLEVLEATVKRSQEQLDRANAMYEAGRAAKVDVYAAEVNLGNDRISVLKQRAAISSAQADLAVWLGRPGQEAYTAQTPAAVEAPPDQVPMLDATLEAARQNRPLLMALAEQVRAAEFGIQVARSGFWPKLSATASAGRAGPSVDPVFTNPRLENYAAVGLQLRWDLFNGFATDAQTEQARIARSQAEVNLAEATREVEGDVHRTVDALAMSVAVVGVAQSNRDSAAKAVQVAEERFKAGAGSTLEVRDAQQKLTQAELSLVSSRIDVEIARANVARVVGAGSFGSRP